MSRRWLDGLSSEDWPSAVSARSNNTRGGRQSASSTPSIFDSVLRASKRTSSPLWAKSAAATLFEPSRLESLFQPEEANSTNGTSSSSSAERFSEARIIKKKNRQGQTTYTVFDASVLPEESVSQCGSEPQLPAPKPQAPHREPSATSFSISGLRPMSQRSTSPAVRHSMATRDYVQEAMAVLRGLRREAPMPNLRLVSPEKVAHLAGHMDQTGMRFDSAKNTWEVLSEGEGQSDPLAHIPNLPSSSSPPSRAISSSIPREVNVDAIHELSFSEAYSDGRVRSVTLRMTPARTPARQTGRVIQHTPQTNRSATFMQTLSPLTEFTVHGQDDKKHYNSRRWCPPDERMSGKKRSTGTSGTVSSLVQSVFELCPDVPWECMKHLDLSDRNLESIHVLHEICPTLIELDARNNKLTHVQGIPPSVRSLDLSGNTLSPLNSWTSLSNIQYLDVSSNDLDSLRGFDCLIHLRQLRASHNRITDLTPIQKLDLQVLDISHNALRHVDFHDYAWQNMEILDMSNNKIREIRGLEYLEALDELELGYNRLTTMEPSRSGLPVNSNPRLRILCASGNRLNELDLSGFPGLETCTADGNRLPRVEGVYNHRSMRTLSLQDMKPGGQLGCTFSLEGLEDITHLSLAGTKLGETFDIREPWLNLRTLEIPRTGIRCLPKEFSRLAPNLRNLDMSNNSVKDLSPISGIRRLKQLLVIGNRIERQRAAITSLTGMNELEEVNMSENPITLGFYNVEEDQLEEGMAMKKRLYEFCLAGKCKALQTLDGDDFDRERANAPDEVYQKLWNFGYVRKSIRHQRQEVAELAGLA